MDQLHVSQSFSELEEAELPRIQGSNPSKSTCKTISQVYDDVYDNYLYGQKSVLSRSGSIVGKDSRNSNGSGRNMIFEESVRHNNEKPKELVKSRPSKSTHFLLIILSIVVVALIFALSTTWYWFKAEKHKGLSNEVEIASAQLSQAKAISMYEDLYMDGIDINNGIRDLTTNPWGCYLKCQEHADCLHWTWVSPETARLDPIFHEACLLKRSHPTGPMNTTFVPGVISGIMWDKLDRPEA